MGVCCCLQTCNSFVNVLVIRFVLGQSVMVISTMGIQRYLPFIMYNGSALLFLHTNYIVYKHFDRSLHFGSSDTT